MELRPPSPSLPLASLSLSTPPPPIRYTRYQGESEVPAIMDLVDSELSEPYNFYTYRYFLNDWYA